MRGKRKSRKTRKGLTPPQAIDRIIAYVKKRKKVVKGDEGFTALDIEPGRRYLHLYLSQALRHLTSLGYFKTTSTYPKPYYTDRKNFRKLCRRRQSSKEN